MNVILTKKLDILDHHSLYTETAFRRLTRDERAARNEGHGQKEITRATG